VSFSPFLGVAFPHPRYGPTTLSVKSVAFVHLLNDAKGGKPE
jgi:hypothetical protein